MASAPVPVHNAPVDTHRARRSIRWLAIVALTLIIGGAPAMAHAGPSSDSLLELAGDRGPSVSFGFGVSPLRWEDFTLPAPLPGTKTTESAMLVDPDARGRAVSLDIKLRWPGAEPKTLLEPYLVFGPALVVDGLHNATDPVLRLGAKAGAGFNWRLGEDTTLFGSYDLTTTDVGGLMSPGASAPAGSATTGYDVLYGVRFRY